MNIHKRLQLSFVLATAVIQLFLLFSSFFFLEISRFYFYQHAGSVGIVYVTGLCIAWLAARMLGGFVFDPLTRLLQEARHLQPQDLHQRLKCPLAEDEVAQLCRLFNEVLERLQHSFALQKNFISNASHEIRNPLTAIIGEAEVCLAKKRNPETYIESLHLIAREADRLDVLVSSLLSLAKTEMGDTSVRMEEVRLDDLLLNLISNINNTKPGHQLKLVFTDLPQQPAWLCLHGNANLLQVALSNLVENAMKFSGKSQVLVSFGATAREITIQVADQGIGIPADDLEKILQPFYRGTNARAYKGFGIGLSLTEKIINMHGGNLHIASAEGKGTTVTLIFKKEQR